MKKYMCADDTAQLPPARNARNTDTKIKMPTPAKVSQQTIFLHDSKTFAVQGSWVCVCRLRGAAILTKRTTKGVCNSQRYRALKPCCPAGKNQSLSLLLYKIQCPFTRDLKAMSQRKDLPLSSVAVKSVITAAQIVTCSGMVCVPILHRRYSRIVFKGAVKMIDVFKPGFKADVNHALIGVFEQAHRLLDAQLI